MSEKAKKKELIKRLSQDALLLLGFSSIFYGFHMIHEPSAFIVGGSIILGSFAYGFVKKPTVNRFDKK